MEIEKNLTEKVRPGDTMFTPEFTYNATEIACQVTQNLPECCISFRCIRFRYGLEYVDGKFTDKIAPENMRFVFVDDEVEWVNGKPAKYTMTIKEAEKGVKMVIDKVLSGELHFTGFSSFMDLMDLGNWDAEVIDVMVQSAVLGEVIYG